MRLQDHFESCGLTQAEGRAADRSGQGGTEGTEKLVSNVGVTLQSGACREVEVRERIVVSLSRLGFEGALSLQVIYALHRLTISMLNNSFGVQ